MSKKLEKDEEADDDLLLTVKRIQEVRERRSYSLSDKGSDSPDGGNSGKSDGPPSGNADVIEFKL